MDGNYLVTPTGLKFEDVVKLNIYTTLVKLNTLSYYRRVTFFTFFVSFTTSITLSVVLVGVTLLTISSDSSDPRISELRPPNPPSLYTSSSTPRQFK